MGGRIARRPDLYDSIRTSYRLTRRADARLARRIRSAVGDAKRVINIGAGTGSYEPDDCTVIAVEPSMVMISQRPARAAPVVRAVAEHYLSGSAASTWRWPCGRSTTGLIFAVGSRSCGGWLAELSLLPPPQ